jgi:protocatechuate 4,5-dioxygenase beta chain
MPRPKRFYEVGVAIRKAIDSIPGDRRVGVLVSGHLSLEIGGPRQFERHLMDPQFDADAVGWIQQGDIKSAVEGCSPVRMMKAGNMTTGYLNFLMMMGVANLTSPSYAEGLDAGFPAIPFFSWDQQV